MNKLEKIGVRGQTLNIFDNYLKERTQSIKIEDYVSEKLPLTYGVPQGSVLGPTLFLAYINQLCLLNIPHCTITTYADDTALIIEGKTWDEARLNAEIALSFVMTWLTNNLLTLNINKTSFILFTASPASIRHIASSFSIKIHSCNDSNNCCCSFLTRVTNIKYLGILIDESLSWQPHIQNLTSRVRKLIYIFKLLRDSATHKVLTTVYNALAQSILSYGIVAWGGAPKTTLLQLERAQRAILKVMIRKHYRYPTADLYFDCKVLTVRKLFILQSALRSHKLLKYDSQLLSTARRKDKICPQESHRTSLAGRQFYILGPRLYNRISRFVSIYSLTTYGCRILIKNWLMPISYQETENLLQISK